MINCSKLGRWAFICNVQKLHFFIFNNFLLMSAKISNCKSLPINELSTTEYRSPVECTMGITTTHSMRLPPLPTLKQLIELLIETSQTIYPWIITKIRKNASIFQKLLKNWFLPFQFIKYCIPWEIEITLPYVFILCLLVKNCFPVLFHIICASTTECSFTAIISSSIKLCLMTLSPVRNYQESPIWHKLVT